MVLNLPAHVACILLHLFLEFIILLPHPLKLILQYSVSLFVLLVLLHLYLLHWRHSNGSLLNLLLTGQLDLSLTHLVFFLFVSLDQVSVHSQSGGRDAFELILV